MKERKYTNIKYYIIFVFVVIIGGYFFWNYEIVPERLKNQSINKSIIAILDAIENDCIQYVTKDLVSQEKLEKCKKIVDYGKSCYQNPDSCSLEDRYDEYSYLGFELPPLYITPTSVR